EWPTKRRSEALSERLDEERNPAMSWIRLVALKCYCQLSLRDAPCLPEHYFVMWKCESLYFALAHDCSCVQAVRAVARIRTTIRAAHILEMASPCDSET